MAERGGAKMLTTREKILFEGLTDWVKLEQVHEYVAFEDLSASLAEVQRRTLELVRSMAEEGVIALGNLIERGARFKDWDIPFDEAIARISARVATMSSAKTALSTACRGLLRFDSRCPAAMLAISDRYTPSVISPMSRASCYSPRGGVTAVRTDCHATT
jgi:hypothetical protein